MNLSWKEINQNNVVYKGYGVNNYFEVRKVTDNNIRSKYGRYSLYQRSGNRLVGRDYSDNIDVLRKRAEVFAKE